MANLSMLIAFTFLQIWLPPCQTSPVLPCSTELVEKILGMWNGPVAPVPAAEEEEEVRQAGQAANQASFLHQLDLLCRRHLSQAMKQLKSSQVSVSGNHYVLNCITHPCTDDECELLLTQ